MAGNFPLCCLLNEPLSEPIIELYVKGSEEKKCILLQVGKAVIKVTQTKEDPIKYCISGQSCNEIFSFSPYHTFFDGRTIKYYRITLLRLIVFFGEYETSLPKELEEFDIIDKKSAHHIFD